MIDTAILFSGGKDSLACLYLNKDRWNDIYVVWCNTGAAYPDVIEYMEKWRKVLPHFIEVKTNQPANIAEFGWPADVLPVNNSYLGKLISGEDTPMMQPYVNCCAANIWFPLHAECIKLGVKYVIKGQKNSDGRKSTSRDRSVIDGIEYRMPVQDWTDEEVFKFLKFQCVELPECYGRGEKKGRDCWDCTAFRDEMVEVVENLPEDKKSIVIGRLKAIDDAVGKQWRPIA